jgi:hypothetical protein
MHHAAVCMRGHMFMVGQLNICIPAYNSYLLGKHIATTIISLPYSCNNNRALAK